MLEKNCRQVNNISQALAIQKLRYMYKAIFMRNFLCCKQTALFHRSRKVSCAAILAFDTVFHILEHWLIHPNLLQLQLPRCAELHFLLYFHINHFLSNSVKVLGNNKIIMIACYCASQTRHKQAEEAQFQQESKKGLWTDGKMLSWHRPNGLSCKCIAFVVLQFVQSQARILQCI